MDMATREMIRLDMDMYQMPTKHRSDILDMIMYAAEASSQNPIELWLLLKHFMFEFVLDQDLNKSR